MDVNCTNCGTLNRSSSHFCAKCGHALPKTADEGDQEQKAQPGNEGGLNLPWLRAVQERAGRQTGGLTPDMVDEGEVQKPAEPEPQPQASDTQAARTPEEGAPPQPGGAGTPEEPPPDWVVGILEPGTGQKPNAEQSYEAEELEHVMPWMSGPPADDSVTPNEPGKPGLPPWLSGITVQETLESSRETSAPDAEDLGLEGLEPFIPPETVEAAAPKRVDAPAPASEKVPEWVKTITAGAASAAEAAQAAKTPDATAAARGPEPSLHTGGLEATGTLMGTIERNMPVRAPRPGSVETLATLLQDPTGEAVRQPVPGVALPARETVTRRAGLMQWLVPDGIIYVAVLAALLAVLLINPPFGEQNAPGATDAIAFYNRIEQVASGKPVLIAYDWDAGRTAEMTALSQAVTHHVMMRHLPFVTISTVPQGPGFAQMITDDAKGEFGYQYGRDYLVLGYLPGNEAALRSLTSDFVNALPRDYVNALPAETYGLLQSGKVTSLRDFGLVIDLASDETALRNWVEQISSRTGIPVIAAVPQGLEPLARPYRRVPGAGLDAVLSGQAGAMRYIQQISSQRDQGTTSRFTTARLAESLNAMSVAQIVVALVILAALVNVGTRKILRRS